MSYNLQAEGTRGVLEEHASMVGEKAHKADHQRSIDDGDGCGGRVGSWDYMRPQARMSGAPATTPDMRETPTLAPLDMASGLEPIEAASRCDKREGAQEHGEHTCTRRAHGLARASARVRETDLGFHLPVQQYRTKETV
eukprot:6214236-Pleurochrysis_carterae.AAC.1